MEQLNRVEIRGTVGSVRIDELSEHRNVHFTVATNYVYKGIDGNVLLETTWHNVLAREKEEEDYLKRLSKGIKVYVLGRIINDKWQDCNGEEHYQATIIAKRVQILEDNNLTMESYDNND